MRVLTLIVLALFSSAAFAADPDELVSAKMLEAAPSSIAPGQRFTVGILLTIKPGWHIYWKNPGDSGLPTRVEFHLPDGFAADEVQFPVPTRFEEPGGIVVYGYQNQVLLMAQIHAPSKHIDAPVSIGATVKWLCCDQTCVPGKSEVQLQRAKNEDDGAIFVKWRKRLPLAGISMQNKGASFTGPLILDEAEPRTEIVTAKLSADEVETIIPGTADGLIVTTDKPREESVGKYAIPVKAKVLAGETVTAKSIPVLIAHTDKSDGAQVGYEVDIPIVNKLDHSTTQASR